MSILKPGTINFCISFDEASILKLIDSGVKRKSVIFSRTPGGVIIFQKVSDSGEAAFILCLLIREYAFAPLIFAYLLGW